jgi:GntR family transcriptional repressor for pyruvate dehydrogenase complex
MLPSNPRPVRIRLSDQVAQEIKKRVFSGVYPPGSRLPPSPQLAAELGVTRLTVREALQHTEAAGFTHSRQGDGTVVTDFVRGGTLALLGEILELGHELTEQEVRSLLELRRVVYVGFAPVIARNASAEHVHRLLAAVAGERDALGDRQAAVERDADFQELLAEASGNVVFALLARTVRPAYVYLSRIVFGLVPDFRPIVNAHEAIARAVEAHDVPRTQQALLAFVAGGNAVVEQALDDGTLVCPSDRPAVGTGALGSTPAGARAPDRDGPAPAWTKVPCSGAPRGA